MRNEDFMLMGFFCDSFPSLSIIVMIFNDNF